MFSLVLLGGFGVKAWHSKRMVILFYFILFYLLLLLFFFCLFAFSGAAAPTAYGDSQARGQTGTTAASLHHSHSNTRTITHCARPGMEPASS